MKKITYSIATTLTISSFLLAQSFMPAFAQNLGGQNIIKATQHLQNQASLAASRQTNELQNIIKHADTLITSRLASLNEIISRIQNDKRLSDSEKNSLNSEIQTAINGLTALKTKIDGDTSITTARNDEKQIITNFYVYAIFMPKIRLLITLNNLQAITANVQTLVPQLQNIITTFKSQGKDVTQVQNLLNDIATQIQTINTTLSSDVTTIEAVSTATTGASSTFGKVQQDIAQIVRTGFAKIRSDFGQMRPLFKQLISGQQSGAPQSASVTTITLSPTTATTKSQ
ncbi:MAG TPA: hypothetical protein VNW29_00775 [Candidatus Sulfotelmatobacter sp.]|jgi:DNA repair exonuclease SbcCD ATPase subunit|nr:hypothetical protein [Candidatus Sulfotelmatobacter sp.]